MVVAGNGMALHLCGWGIFKLEIAGQTFSHEIGVGKDLPVDILIGGEVMRPMLATTRLSKKLGRPFSSPMLHVLFAMRSIVFWVK